jgi:hypothetical protein
MINSLKGLDDVLSQEFAMTAERARKDGLREKVNEALLQWKQLDYTPARGEEDSTEMRAFQRVLDLIPDEYEWSIKLEWK